MELSFFSAFVAGLITFIAPCTLPLLPGYIAYISGMGVGELKDQSKKIHIKTFLYGLAFVVGFSLVFVLMGVLAGYLGSFFVSFQEWLTRIGGLIVILFGLFLLGVLNISFLEKTFRVDISKYFKKGSFISAFLFGASFGVGWSPCVGPLLGAILLIASSSATVGTGALLLTTFSLGLAVPFLLVSLMSGYALQYIQKLNLYLKYFSVLGGVFLILLGVLMLFNQFDLIIVWGYRLLDVVNYDALLNYL